MGKLICQRNGGNLLVNLICKKYPHSGNTLKRFHLFPAWTKKKREEEANLKKSVDFDTIRLLSTHPI